MPSNSGWIVTSQQANQVILDNAANPSVGTYIYYTTGEGNQGVVFLPDSHRSEKHARKAVDADADILDTIGRMSHNWPPKDE